MRRLFAVSLVGLIATSLGAAPAPPDSWGKAGVSLAQYRQDAVDCAIQGYNLDISKTDDAKEFVRASHELDNVPGGMSIQMASTGTANGNSVTDMVDWSDMQQHIVASARPEERFKHIKQMQVAKIDQCLMQRGYSKFHLTDEQRHRLSKLKFGSDERRQYLYGLATDPTVLHTQAAAVQP